MKCGFPTSQLEKYFNLFKTANLSFKIIDASDNSLYSPKDFVLNKNLKVFLEKISSVKAYDLSISAAYDFIDKISEESKLLLGDYVKNGKE